MELPPVFNGVNPVELQLSEPQPKNSRSALEAPLRTVCRPGQEAALEAGPEAGIPPDQSSGAWPREPRCVKVNLNGYRL